MGIAPITAQVTVSTAGTRVALSTQITAAYVSSLYLEGLNTNSGSIFVGNATVSLGNYAACLPAGVGFSINAMPTSLEGGPGGGLVTVANIYFDATANSQVVMVSYMNAADKY
jgi:hypothetical protein